MNRHWVVMALGLAAGIALGGTLPPGSAVALGAAAFCGVLALVWTAGRMPLRDIVAVFGCCAAAGALLFHLSAPPRGGDDLSLPAVQENGALCTLEGVVREAPALVRPDERCRFELSVETVRMEGRTRPLAPS
ncbi:MAG TPA: DUF4131 domain-containing protein, partial [Candidatus Hydrogenedentes bacterium]|nr:DUF4131 domain-containing protein [Candidatus Hydrogenedentota bacterium]